MKSSVIFLSVLSFVLPSFALAQIGGGNLNKTFFLIQGFAGIVDLLIGVLAGLALLVFIWGLVKYIWSQGNDGKVDGKKIMVGGVIALFVLFSVWGILQFIGDNLGIQGSGGSVAPPKVNF